MAAALVDCFTSKTAVVALLFLWERLRRFISAALQFYRKAPPSEPRLADDILTPSPADYQDEAFLSCSPPTLYGRYRITGDWYLCRIKSSDLRRGYTIVWEDGTTQDETQLDEIRRPDASSLEQIDALHAEQATDASCKEARVNQMRTYHRRSLKRTQSRLCCSASDQRSTLFASTAKPTLYGRYRHTGGWMLCRVRSVDIDGTCTVVWQDGVLQTGTTKEELRIPSEELAEMVEAEVDSATVGEHDCQNSGSEPRTNAELLAYSANRMKAPTRNGITVWEAARQGDFETTLTLIDSGDAGPNDVEVIGSNNAESDLQGRTPLYWACFIGHAELVRELVARGGIDSDGSAYLAVTSRAKAKATKDINIDSNHGVISNLTKALHTEEASKVTCHAETAGEDNTALIRAMLVAASSSSNRDESSIRRRLPKRLYRSAEAASTKSGECVICLANKADAIFVPCGHIACCLTCVKEIRKNRDGCPICRSRIIATVPWIFSTE